MSAAPGDERLQRRLQDLAAFAQDAEYTVELGLATYLAETPDGRILRNSARHVLIQVATVVEKLPEWYKADYPSVDWVAVGRMRNLIAPHYDRAHDHLIFRTLAARIPALLRDLDL